MDGQHRYNRERACRYDRALTPVNLIYTRGFTLVELLVFTTVSLLLIAAALRVYADARQTAQTALAMTDLQERAAFAMT